MDNVKKNELYHDIKHFLVQNFPGFEPQDYNLVTAGLIEKFKKINDKEIEINQIEKKGTKVPKTKGLFCRAGAEGEGVWINQKDRVIQSNNDFEVEIVNPVTGDFEVSKFVILK